MKGWPGKIATLAIPKLAASSRDGGKDKLFYRKWEEGPGCRQKKRAMIYLASRKVGTVFLFVSYLNKKTFEIFRG